MAYFMIQPLAGFSVEQVPAYRGCLRADIRPSNRPSNRYGVPRLLAWHEARKYLTDRMRQLRVLAPALPRRDPLSLQLASKLHEVVKATLLNEDPNFPEFDSCMEPILPARLSNQHLLLVRGGINDIWWDEATRVLESGAMPEEQPRFSNAQLVWLTVLGERRLQVPIHLEFSLCALRRPTP